MDIKLVFATSPTKSVDGETRHAFGLGNSLPWGYLKQDMINFSKRTKGTMVVMGAKTFLSLPDLLSDRVHMVVVSDERELPKTKNGKSAEYYIFDSEFEEFLKTGKCGGMAVWDNYTYSKNLQFHLGYSNISVIGGASLLRTSLKYATSVVKTTIEKKHYVTHDVSIDNDFIDEIITKFLLVETHWWNIDELTELTESVLVRKVI